MGPLSACHVKQGCIRKALGKSERGGNDPELKPSMGAIRFPGLPATLPGLNFKLARARVEGETKQNLAQFGL